MPPRTAAGLRAYKEACAAVIERAAGKCEVLLDRKGQSSSRLPKIRRCAISIPQDQARYINFLHRSTRNGHSAAWVNNPDNIIYGCASHHVDEEQTHLRVKGVDYEDGELTYIPED